MKITKFALLAGILAALSPCVLRADDADANAAAPARDFHFTVGLKGWNASWNSFLFNSYEGELVSINGGSQFAAIPNFSVRYKKLFVSGSYVAQTSYKFNPLPYWNGSSYSYNTFEAKRSESDINLGWSFIPQLSATIGYKSLSYHFRDTSATLPDWSKYDISGLTIGIAGSGNIYKGLSMYGNLGFGGLASKSTQYRFKNTTYLASELGFAYKFSAPVLVTLGYKYQVLENKFNKASDGIFQGQTGQDMTHGFMLGISYVY